jgi:hypothetical protein
MLNQISEFSHFFTTFRRFSQFVEWRSASSTQDSYPSIPPPPPGTFFQPQSKPNICVVTNEAEGHRELDLIGVLPSLDGIEGLERRAFYYWKSGKGKPLLLLQQRLVGFWALAARARPCAARTRLFGRINTPNGALRTHRSFAASYSSPQNKKINYFQKQNAFLQELRPPGTRGVYLSTGISCTLLRYIAPY